VNALPPFPKGAAVSLSPPTLPPAHGALKFFNTFRAFSFDFFAFLAYLFLQILFFGNKDLVVNQRTKREMNHVKEKTSRKPCPADSPAVYPRGFMYDWWRWQRRG
jgi:hypothetical protein